MAQEIYHRSNWGNPTETWGNVYLNADLTNELYKRASEYENSWVTDQLLNGVGTKPSIILTPTAYEDGILNSVKPAKPYSDELVTNGNFSDGTNGWVGNVNTTLSVSSGQLDIQSAIGLYGVAFSEVNFVEGKKYLIKLDVISTDRPTHIRVGTSSGISTGTATNIFASGEIGIGSHEKIFTAT